VPIVGAVTGGLDFSNHFLALSSKVTADSLVEAKNLGTVLALVLNFMIVAFVRSSGS
jgi:large conductance mechanosensitive channel